MPAFQNGTLSYISVEANSIRSDHPHLQYGRGFFNLCSSPLSSREPLKRISRDANREPLKSIRDHDIPTYMRDLWQRRGE